MIEGIPDGWQLAALGHIAQVERGKFTHRPRNDPRFYGGAIPFVQTGDVAKSQGRIRTYSQTLNELGLSVSKTFPAGVILITIAANIGFTGILEFESACPDSLVGITPRDDVDVGFLHFYLVTQQPEMDRLAPKGTQKNINIQFLRPWPVPLPPLAEQRQIAGVLGVVQRAMEQQERLLALTAELKQTLLHQLFTAGLRGEPQKQTDLGLIPESWEVVSIGRTGKVVTGSTPSTKRPEFYGGDYNLISPADLDAGKYITSAHRKLTQAGFAECRALPTNAVVVGCIGNIGKIGLTADDKCATNQQINAIICGKDFNPHFVYYSLQFYRPRLERAAAKVTLPILNKSNFESFQIAAPKKPVQDEIADVVCILDDKTEILSRKKRTLEDLFRTLLHQLMTAQLRVHDLDVEGLLEQAVPERQADSP